MEGDAKYVGEAMAQLLRSFRIFLLPFAGLIRRLPLPQNRRSDAARETVKQIVSRVIQEHRAPGNDNYDLLSNLLSVRDVDGSALSDEQIRTKYLRYLLLAKTTALALTWTWYLLAQHPDCERTLHAS